MSEVPRASATKVTVERRGHIVLIGIKRPDVYNRIDPETYSGLGKAFYQYDHDLSPRAAVLFGHGDNFSRGVDARRAGWQGASSVDRYASIIRPPR